MGQKRGAGPRPFLSPHHARGRFAIPQCPPAPGPRLTAGLWAVLEGMTGCQGKGTASSPRRTGPPPQQPSHHPGKGPPQGAEPNLGPQWGRCWGLPCAPTLTGGGGLERGAPTLSSHDPHRRSRATLGRDRRGLGWGAVGVLQRGSPHPWPRMPRQGAELLSQAGARPGARPRALAQGAGAAAVSRIPCRPLDPSTAPASRATAGHHGPPPATTGHRLPGPCPWSSPLHGAPVGNGTGAPPWGCSHQPHVAGGAVAGAGLCPGGTGHPQKGAEGAQPRLTLEAL